MKRTVNVACVGDSLTEGGYPRVLQELLEAREPSCKWKVHNLGVLGSDTKDWLHTHLASSKVREVANAGVDVFCVMLGTNDAQVQLMFNEQQYQERLTQIGRSFMNEGVAVLLISPPPVEPGAFFTQFIDVRVANTVLPRIVPEIADGIGCGFADAFSALGGATPKHEALIDGVHLTPEGNHLVANAVLDAVLHTVLGTGGGNSPMKARGGISPVRKGGSNPPMRPRANSATLLLPSPVRVPQVTTSPARILNKETAGRLALESELLSPSPWVRSYSSPQPGSGLEPVSPSTPVRIAAEAAQVAQATLAIHKAQEAAMTPVVAAAIAAGANHAAAADVFAAQSPMLIREESPKAAEEGQAFAIGDRVEIVYQNQSYAGEVVRLPGLRLPGDDEEHLSSYYVQCDADEIGTLTPVLGADVTLLSAPSTSLALAPQATLPIFEDDARWNCAKCDEPNRPERAECNNCGVSRTPASMQCPVALASRISPASSPARVLSASPNLAAEAASSPQLGHASPPQPAVADPLSTRADHRTQPALFPNFAQLFPNFAQLAVGAPLPQAPPHVVAEVAAMMAPVAGASVGELVAPSQRFADVSTPATSGPPTPQRQLSQLAASTPSHSPQTARPPQSNGYFVGEPVEVFSNTFDKWFLGRIDKVQGNAILTEFVAPDGREKEKWMPIGHPQMRLVAVAPVAQATSPMHSPPKGAGHSLQVPIHQPRSPHNGAASVAAPRSPSHGAASVGAPMRPPVPLVFNGQTAHLPWTRQLSTDSAGSGSQYPAPALEDCRSGQKPQVPPMQQYVAL